MSTLDLVIILAVWVGCGAVAALLVWISEVDESVQARQERLEIEKKWRDLGDLDDGSS